MNLYESVTLELPRRPSTSSSNSSSSSSGIVSNTDNDARRRRALRALLDLRRRGAPKTIDPKDAVKRGPPFVVGSHRFGRKEVSMGVDIVSVAQNDRATKITIIVVVITIGGGGEAQLHAKGRDKYLHVGWPPALCFFARRPTRDAAVAQAGKKMASNYSRLLPRGLL